MHLPNKKRITHKDVQEACNRYNKAFGFTSWNSIGRIKWADIAGFGVYSPKLYVVCNENGGVCVSDMRRKTMRQTIEAIDWAIKADALPIVTW